MSEQPTTYRDSAATEFDNDADVALHMSNKPMVHGATLEAYKPRTEREQLLESIAGYTTNLDLAQKYALDTNGSMINPQQELTPEERGYTLAA